ncbi:DDE_3 domain-containing protein [Trichonephila clavipes]|nr:DDE_3 domain-containing protein [Trichonephila clavipes]
MYCYSHGNGVYQQGNCISHKSRLATGWLDEHLSDFSVITSQVSKQDPKGHHTTSTNLLEFCTVLDSIWQVISMKRFKKLVECMPNWVVIVMKAREGPTRY